MSEQYDEQAKLARLNDEYRRTTFDYNFTPGILDEATDATGAVTLDTIIVLLGLIQQIKEYDDFTEDNDPHGEHDFGVVDWHAKKVYWKLDYYDKNEEYRVEPFDPECCRVLTVMLAEES